MSNAHDTAAKASASVVLDSYRFFCLSLNETIIETETAATAQDVQDSPADAIRNCARAGMCGQPHNVADVSGNESASMR
jgi:hypothetical protein